MESCSCTAPTQPLTHLAAFYFDKMIAADAQQDDVFSSVGKPICEGALSSTSPTNSVLFSFGVSNSGKTWTLLGGEGKDRTSVR